MITLGIDTSNYTTSCALFDSDNNRIIQKKRLLPVKSGEKGLRQSDAVFHHTQQLSLLLEDLFSEYRCCIDAIGVSSKPRDVTGSYMPCFTVGINVAMSVASVINKPVFEFSHQSGHIAAAAYSANELDLLKNNFIAFHASGGTTEGLYITPDFKRIIKADIITDTADLNCGQVIDRCGVMLGLDFPCGPKLETLAKNSETVKRIKPAFKDGKCNLSGLENVCRKMFDGGYSHSDIARYCLDYVCETVSVMTEYCLTKCGNLPVLYAGGVMSNRLIRATLSSRFDSYFAEPAFSSDNAAGIAILTYLKVNNNA